MCEEKLVELNIIVVDRVSSANVSACRYAENQMEVLRE
jgi:hypothetical protein